MPYQFQTSWRVRFDEVDLQGVVHHSRIVTYLEIARLEYWRHLGISYRHMLDEGYEFIVSRVNVDYIKPLIFDEIIKIDVGVVRLARASFVLGYEIYSQGGDLAAIAETKLVCARVGVGKPTALPPFYLGRLRAAHAARPVPPSLAGPETRRPRREPGPSGEFE